VLVGGGGGGSGEREGGLCSWCGRKADLMSPGARLHLVLLADLFVWSIVHPG
jgi:hypothetical protein